MKISAKTRKILVGGLELIESKRPLKEKECVAIAISPKGPIFIIQKQSKKDNDSKMNESPPPIENEPSAIFENQSAPNSDNIRRYPIREIVQRKRKLIDSEDINENKESTVVSVVCTSFISKNNGRAYKNKVQKYSHQIVPSVTIVPTLASCDSSTGDKNDDHQVNKRAKILAVPRTQNLYSLGMSPIEEQGKEAEDIMMFSADERQEIDDDDSSILFNLLQMNSEDNQ